MNHNLRGCAPGRRDKLENKAVILDIRNCKWYTELVVY